MDLSLRKEGANHILSVHLSYEFQAAKSVLGAKHQLTAITELHAPDRSVTSQSASAVTTDLDPTAAVMTIAEFTVDFAAARGGGLVTLTLVSDDLAVHSVLAHQFWWNAQSGNVELLTPKEFFARRGSRPTPPVSSSRLEPGDVPGERKILNNTPDPGIDCWGNAHCPGRGEAP